MFKYPFSPELRCLEKITSNHLVRCSALSLKNSIIILALHRAQQMPFAELTLWSSYSLRSRCSMSFLPCTLSAVKYCCKQHSARFTNDSYFVEVLTLKLSATSCVSPVSCSSNRARSDLWRAKLMFGDPFEVRARHHVSTCLSSTAVYHKSAVLRWRANTLPPLRLRTHAEQQRSLVSLWYCGGLSSLSLVWIFVTRWVVWMVVHKHTWLTSLCSSMVSSIMVALSLMFFFSVLYTPRRMSKRALLPIVDNSDHKSWHCAISGWDSELCNANKQACIWHHTYDSYEWHPE